MGWKIGTPTESVSGTVAVPFTWDSHGAAGTGTLEYRRVDGVPALVGLRLAGTDGSPIPFAVPGRGLNWAGLIATAAYVAGNTGVAFEPAAVVPVPWTDGPQPPEKGGTAWDAAADRWAESGIPEPGPAPVPTGTRKRGRVRRVDYQEVADIYQRAVLAGDRHPTLAVMEALPGVSKSAAAKRVHVAYQLKILPATSRGRSGFRAPRQG
jgi:hypothetical protein